MQYAQPSEPAQGAAVVLELDEMWHYLKKNESYGFGKFCVVIQENSSLGGDRDKTRLKKLLSELSYHKMY